MRFTSISICLFLACGLVLGADKDDKAKALAEILVQDDDGLPEGVTALAAKTDQKDQIILLRGMPKAQAFASREFEKDSKPRGIVSAFTYTNATSRAKAFKVMTSTMSEKATKLEDVGDKSMFTSIHIDVAGYDYWVADVAFIRGNQAVFVRMLGDDPIEATKAYAKRLDERLKKELPNKKK